MTSRLWPLTNQVVDQGTFVKGGVCHVPVFWVVSDSGGNGGHFSPTPHQLCINIIGLFIPCLLQVLFVCLFFPGFDDQRSNLYFVGFVLFWNVSLRLLYLSLHMWDPPLFRIIPVHYKCVTYGIEKSCYKLFPKHIIPGAWRYIKKKQKTNSSGFLANNRR